MSARVSARRLARGVPAKTVRRIERARDQRQAAKAAKALVSWTASR